MTVSRSLIPWRSRGLSTWGGPETRPFNALQRVMNDMLEDFAWGTPFQGGELAGFSPDIEFSEDEKEYHITVELPGVREEDVDISMTDGSLAIRGEKKEEREERKRDYVRRERTYGSFSRTIPLPGEVNKDKISAKLADGVLQVDLPKTKEAQTVKRIQIKH